LSASSKAASVLLTYPYQVVRARQQVVGADYSTPSISRTIWKESGMRGLYRGSVFI
jgi:hypothetical protein